MDKNAFTMAETLITLGIIGVIAALTLPIGVNNAHDRDFRAMLNKQYCILYKAS